jgi:anthranilate synthase component 1
MLIDLERNDLGRVCAPGTVEVDELMVVESYAHVHHIVSNVRGRLRPQVTPGQLIAATFPGGTITGCPKVRCMEIIAELEDAPRGAYTGAMGYLDRNGDMDLNILIRTLAVVGDTVTLRAGAGIVADSVAAAELDETRAKARGLLRALGATD